MKKLLIVLGISSVLAIAACETPQPTSDPNNTDSTTTARPDSGMSQPDTTRNQ
jgi:uncharacterized lipoprotein